MKDIDFDELDKAVNSLMTRTQKEKPDDSVASDVTSASNTPSRDEPGIPTTAAPVSPGTVKPKSAEATNPDVQPAVTPNPPSRPTTQSQAPTSSTIASRPGAPAVRRSGRFMDVVPQKTNPTPPLSRPATREGVAISPRQGAGADMSSGSGSQSSPLVSPASLQSKPMVTEKVAPKSDWPDPIEVATAKKPITEKEPEVKPEKPPVPQPTEEKAPKDQPLTSPFLPNAKVEKRPLGSPASNLPMNAPEAELMKMPAPDDSESQLPAKPSDVATIEAPEEFGGDIMKVEADTHMGVPKTDESPEHSASAAVSAPSQAAGIMTPQDTKDSEKNPEPKTKVTEKAEDLTAAPSASGRISIPPQYKEQPSTGDTESGAIYDTSTYHQPLMHPAKKKSGWLWVLWIVLILIVGAGAGAALYFLGVM